MTATAQPAASHAATTHIDVTVVYNGLSKTFTVPPTDASRALLERALREFGIQQNAHLHSLFTQDGVELADAQSLKDAGVVDGTRLLLRPSQIRGGTS